MVLIPECKAYQQKQQTNNATSHTTESYLHLNLHPDIRIAYVFDRVQIQRSRYPVPDSFLVRNSDFASVVFSTIRIGTLVNVKCTQPRMSTKRPREKWRTVRDNYYPAVNERNCT